MIKSIIFAVFMTVSTTTVNIANHDMTSQSFVKEGIVVVIVGRTMEIPGDKGELLSLQLKDPNGNAIAEGNATVPGHWAYNQPLPMAGTYTLEVTYPTGNIVVYTVPNGK